MSHYTGGPRREAIVVHHYGSPNTGGNVASAGCYVPGDHYYDFCCARNGSFYNTTFWNYTPGGHAFQANCNTIGVMMQGCYGGCSSGNEPGGFSDGQLCALAYISLHLAFSVNNLWNHINHNKAASWKPCPCSTGCCGTGCDCACATACCGTTFTSGGVGDHGWNSFGVTQMNRMFWMRQNLANGFNCLGTCPC